MQSMENLKIKSGYTRQLKNNLQKNWSDIKIMLIILKNGKVVKAAINLQLAD